MSRSVVYVYNGLGVSEESLSMLWSTLSRLLVKTRYTAKYISPEEIKQGDWCDDAALLTIGGGYDLGFMEALGATGTTTIKKYVQRGGSYLGICAGGYFACDSIVFDKGNPLEVCGERHLKFYSGQCIGPAFPGFKYNSHAGAHTPRLLWSSNSKVPKPTAENFSCYFNGGGYFTASQTESCQILAVFKDLAESPGAIVHCEVGDGKAVLCGVHPEYTADDLDSEDPNLKEIIPVVRENEHHCQLVIISLLQSLGLDFTF